MRDAARFFREHGIRAIGICLMHSYANDAHERRVAEIVAEEYPEATLSLSCVVLPEYREYERAVTTLVDAFVKPHMERYLKRVHDELGAGLRDKPFLVMQSSGGVASAEQVVRKPITTALSGPAAGALGSAVIAEIAGFPDLVTLDAGGTSTDLCLIEGGKPQVTNGGSVGPFPVRIPMIDIETIGTGGGSIAWISREGHLKVGPRSAGAEPGPMCYPNGGNEPTITDANLVLGRIPPALIGGGIALDVERARGGIAALAAAAARQHERRAARQRHHRDRQLEPGQRHPPDDDPARHRPARLRAAVVRRRRAGAVGRGDGSAWHEGLHRAAEPGQSLGLRPARGRLAHRSHRHQGDARGRHRSRGRRGALCRAGAGSGRDAGARRHRGRRASALVREADIRYAGQSMEVRVAAPGGADRCVLPGRADRAPSTPRICAPSATIMPASRRSSWSISASPASA